MYQTGSTLLADTWIIYLRKSRQDDPRETVEEVLEKHETMLQEYAQRELGGRIPEDNIYREVVSGESIDDRVEIKKVLSRLEDPAVKGVLVAEKSIQHYPGMREMRQGIIPAPIQARGGPL